MARPFADRIAVHAVDQPGMYDMGGGARLRLPTGDPLTGEPLLVVLDVDGDRRRGTIHLAAAVTVDELRSHVPDLLSTEVVSAVVDGIVRTSESLLTGGLVLQRRNVPGEPAELVRAVLAHVVAAGLSVLPWSPAALRDRARLHHAHVLRPDVWPAVDDHLLLAELDKWLGDELRRHPVSRLADIDTGRALLSLAARLGGRPALDALFPLDVHLPSGNPRKVRYELGEPPRLAAALRDLYGSRAGPSVGAGRVPVVLELLSPAGRPVAITDDLARFWTLGYPAVRSEMRGRYPKHHWPQDPTEPPPRRSP